jgi:uroporphyrinogen decarboxylase
MAFNDRFLRACRGEKTSPVPVWFMRQAGRYLPEYQAVRGKHDFLTMCKTPELAAEVTLQPVDLLGVDAAILFSDILIPLEAMGTALSFQEGRGPVLDPPVRSRGEFERLHDIDPEQDVPFVLDTIRLLRRELEDRVPLIGFAGAPFTMATYLIEGGTTKSFVNIKRMAFEAPELFHDIMDLITRVTVSYLSAQIDAGAQAVQLFDTWAGILGRADYERFALPYARRILEALEGKGVPRIYFVFNGGHLLDLVRSAGADVVGLDWRTDIEMALSILGPDVSVQGNMDPCALFMPEDGLRQRIASILEQGRGAKSHIFNLGHGVMPEIPPEKVKMAVAMAHELSAEG